MKFNVIILAIISSIVLNVISRRVKNKNKVGSGLAEAVLCDKVADFGFVCIKTENDKKLYCWQGQGLENVTFECVPEDKFKDYAQLAKKEVEFKDDKFTFKA